MINGHENLCMGIKLSRKLLCDKNKTKQQKSILKLFIIAARSIQLSCLVVFKNFLFE